jgi:hypothetical protein
MMAALPLVGAVAAAAMVNRLLLLIPLMIVTEPLIRSSALTSRVVPLPVTSHLKFLQAGG